MAPRVPMSKENGMDEFLKPMTDKAKVEKAKVEPKPKVKAEKAEKVKAEKVPKSEKAPKVVKLKVEKAEKNEKKTAEKAGDGKVAEKVVKVKPVSGDEAVALIMEYLKAQNRPYSATEISANLHGKVTKTVADKLLKELGEAKELGMHSTNKDAKGSQFVFWALQDANDVATPEELAAMDAEIASLKASLPALRNAFKASAAKLANLKSALSVSEIQTIIDNLRLSNAEKRERLDGFKHGQVKQVSKEEMVRVEKELTYWEKKRAVRKQAYLDLENQLVDTGKSRDDIREELGIEVD